jgi:hypothetical protein
MSRSVVLRLKRDRPILLGVKTASGSQKTQCRRFPDIFRAFRHSLIERIHQYRDDPRPQESQSHPQDKQDAEVAFAAETVSNQKTRATVRTTRLGTM